MLGKLLALMEREEVTEVLVRSGVPPQARVRGSYQAILPNRVTLDEVLKLVQGTALAGKLPRADAPPSRHQLHVGADEYLAVVRRSGDIIELRFLRQEDARRPTVPPSARAPAGADPALRKLLEEARRARASDLHVVAGQPARIRRAESLEPVGEVLTGDRVTGLLGPLLSPAQRERVKKVGYVDLSLELPGGGRLRLNVGRHAGGLKGCFRLVMDSIPTLGALGLPEELAAVADYHQGLAIVSGPNGHGKTTTMAALVDLINGRKPAHILTVEDPVEFVHQKKRALVSHREVGLHTSSFARALKGALRQDPDVIVIGELRDMETVEIALTAAETGHLVLTTMSTRSGAKTISRLIDMFPPDDQAQVRATLAGALKVIVSQRLVPSLTGSELVAASELITGGVPLWNLIRDDKLMQLPSLQQRGRSAGMIRLDDSLLELVKRQAIRAETALAHAESAAQMSKQLGAAKL